MWFATFCVAWQFLAVKLKNEGTLNVVHMKTSNENSDGAAGRLQRFAYEKAVVGR